jgi:hypothetical protein
VKIKYRQKKFLPFGRKWRFTPTWGGRKEAVLYGLWWVTGRRRGSYIN